MRLAKEEGALLSWSLELVLMGVLVWVAQRLSTRCACALGWCVSDDEKRKIGRKGRTF